MTAEKPGKLRRWLRLAGRAIGIPLLLAGAGISVWGCSTLPRTDGEVRLAGIAGEVEIYRDVYGVPHIFAGSANDAWFALGYVHAQDRMWQMEFTRRLGAGRLAEVVGEPGLSVDRFMRTLGLYGHAEVAAERLSADTLAAMEAFAAGVNAWLEHRAAWLPPEFMLLNYDPEPWRVADSIVWGNLLAYQLSGNWHGELFRAGLSRHMEAAQIAELWPGEPAGAPITLDAARRAAKLDINAMLSAEPAELRSHSASNAWVMAGSRTATGAPILANDPHLGFTAPVTWYLMRIETPEMTLVGATAPGMPFPILGHNGHVAWGMTSTGGDTQDLFVETLAPGNPDRYLSPDGPLSFETREETIHVKNGKDVALTVRRTRHGPVISDVLEDSKDLAGEKTVVALAAAADGPGQRSADALAAVAGARTASEFERIVSAFQAPLVNILFADTEGTIGFVTPGLLPIRRAGDGRYPVDGASGEYDWTGFVPVEGMPRLLNAAAGAIVNANNRLVGEDYPHLITSRWDDAYRAERIHEMLDGGGKISVADTMRHQGDVLSPAARALVPKMLAVAGEGVGGRAGRALEMLAGWDYRMAADRPEPLIYQAWLRHAVRRIAKDEMGDDFDLYWRPRPGFVGHVLAVGARWCGGDCGDEMRAALDDALKELVDELGGDMSAWRWDALHEARFVHRLFNEIPIINRLGNLSIPTGGGDNTVGRGMTAGRGEEPYAHIHGAGYKAVYDLSDLANSRFMLAAGQSGNPFSDHYADLLEPWRDGQYIRIAGSRESLALAGYDRLLLLPAVR